MLRGIGLELTPKPRRNPEVEGRQSPLPFPSWPTARVCTGHVLITSDNWCHGCGGAAARHVGGWRGSTFDCDETSRQRGGLLAHRPASPDWVLSCFLSFVLSQIPTTPPFRQRCDPWHRSPAPYGHRSWSRHSPPGHAL